MVTTSRLLTAVDLMRLPDDGQRHELIAGELRTMTPSGGEHGQIAASIIASLYTHVRAHRLRLVFGAETGFLLARDPDTVRAPDAAFVRQDRVQAVGRTPGYWPGAPDLTVEVIAPHDLYTEVEAKVAMWLTHGCRLVLVVNPCQQTVVVHRSPSEARRLTSDDTLEGADVVPGWTLPVRDLFADPTGD